ncbi:MAG: response regulator [Fluviicola sp.]
MNLEYKILWFEDEPASFNAKKRLVKRIVENFGFNFPDPKNEIDGSNIDNLNFAKYDLIISDLKLSDVEGTTVLDIIREKGIYTEVVFYSSIGESALREELKRFEIDGVYCADRTNENFKEKVEKVIETTIKKVQDVNNTRGLVIAETILLEKKIENILLEYFNETENILEEQKGELLRNIHSKKVTRHKSEIEELEKVDFKDIKILIEKDVLTASNSFDAVQSILKSKIKDLGIQMSQKGILTEERIILEEKRSRLTVIKAELNNFRDEILKIRNTLAHVEEEFGDDGVPFLNSLNSDGSIIRFDNTEYIKIRRDFIKHNNNLDTIIEQLK